jgi:hypothetical protein
MVLRAVAVGVVCLGALHLGCSRTAPILTPTVIVVGPVSGGGFTSSSEEPSSSGGTWVTREEVEVEWHGSWWPALVLERRGGRWLVHYEGYGAEWDEVVATERIRERRAEPEIDQPREMEDEPDP